MSNKMSGSVQVKGNYKAGQLETYASGRVSCRVFGQVTDYYGLKARAGAMFPVLELDADTVAELRAEARKAIDTLNKQGTRLISCTSVKMFRAAYEGV